ncbi:hypothetical protein DSCO28_11600 [Desulfosarcina ovata subsp. sediminis]|uniref:PilZ domain-containing protein n=1 Tax=Desulfosarcina ovata subsp. sediminis TaxID=885957 RepID=A0A5K7ZGX2_9BACT|nr:hypothetical protein [Desulfosarcina ovata]BBO80594.1 hypothetical protein DSCO28_11600 [Desulfosarcina ovata subsp. sediminis]
MPQLQEKRNFVRHRGNGQLTLLHTHANARHIQGSLINFSEQGISFFSYRPVTPGTTVIVRASGENYRQLPPGGQCLLRSMGFCTVKWCQETKREGVPMHEMGAVYVMPY